MERKLEVSLRCEKCHSHHICGEFIENEVDGDSWFIVCDDCGFDREATEDDFENAELDDAETLWA